VWTVVRDERVELHGADGSVLAWARPDRAMSGLHDAGGQLAVVLRPQVKDQFALRNLLRLAVDGVVMGNSNNKRYSRNRISGPPLLVVSTRPQLTLAEIAPDDNGSHVINLVPAGRLNDRLLSRSVSLETSSRLRACNPLTLTKMSEGMEQLADVAGRVFARAAYARVPIGASAAGDTDDHPQSVEVLDNDLPAIVLYAVLVGAHGWHS
jgi:hypothetical protein